MTVAIVALAISAGGLAVQLSPEWRAWSTRVKLKVEPTFVGRVGEQPEPVVLFRIINRSDHSVRVTHLGMEPIKKDRKSIFFPRPLPAEPGPWPAPPHDSIELYQPAGSLSDGDPDYKTRARVMTSDGRTVRSKRVRVRDLSA
jgi:hypothetical protein